jgi:hypothetical protein
VRRALLAILLTAAPAVSFAARTGDRERYIAPAIVQQALAESISFATTVARANAMGMTITNYGFLGNNFSSSRAPSLEFPLGTGYEHMVRGGLWIGGKAIDPNTGQFTGVVTGTVDGSQTSAAASATEFTPAGREIGPRSIIPRHAFFSQDALSELDLLTWYSDSPAKTAEGTGEAHRPMGLYVRQENYAWSFADYANTLFFRFVIVNTGPPLQDVWVGVYTEFASGPKNLYFTWPPTASGSNLGGWYGHKWIQYDAPERLFREHYCRQLPIPGGCDLGLVPYWIGLKLLGVSPGDVTDTLDKRVTLGAWDWDPGNATRNEDLERYAIMSAGTIQDLNAADLQPLTGDPVAVLAVGPFRQINPSDSIAVDFAVVGGAEVSDIQRVAETAQRAYDRGYVIPVPPFSPAFKVVARQNEVDLYWDNSSESAVDSTSQVIYDFEGYRVYLGEDRLSLPLVAQFDRDFAPHDTTGFNTGFDAVRLNPPAEFDGVPYHYRYTARNLRDGFKYFAAVTAYDLGTPEIQSLESGIAQNKSLTIPAAAPGARPDDKVTVFPNPYRVEAVWDQGQQVRDHYLWFANLPRRCTLKIYTLSGDLVFETEFDGDTYTGQGTRGIYDPRRELDVSAPTMSGSMFGWDMITLDGQAAATGLYLFSVKDRDSDKRQVGKFLIVKSDREGS